MTHAKEAVASCKCQLKAADQRPKSGPKPDRGSVWLISMFSTFTHDLSVCLRCQYRAVIQRRIKRTVVSSVAQSSRYLASSSQTTAPSERTDSRDERTRREKWRRIPNSVPIQSREAFGMSSHSKRGEILQLRQNLERKFVSHFPLAEEVGDSEPVALDPGKIVEAIETRGKTVDSKEITETLGSIRLAWSQNISGYPTAEEIDALTQRLCNGFTTKQLQSYFANKESFVPLPSKMELLEPRKTSLYTRSSWKFGTTPFPTPAKPNSQSNRPQSKAQKIPGRDKRAIAQKIVQKRWQLRAQEEMCSVGEVDILLPGAVLTLLVEHKRNILERLAKQFETKTDATLSGGLVRITANFDTCTEVFNALRETLEQIQMKEISSPLLESMVHKDSRPGQLDLLGKLTNTVIRISDQPEKKLHIYYFGPGDDDLEDAQRLISQLFHSPTYRHPVLYAPNGSLQHALPIRIEAGTALPLVSRSRRWIRWTDGSRRAMKADKNEGGPVGKDSNASTSTKSTCSTLMDESNSETIVNHMRDVLLEHWADSSLCESSAVFGYILYPMLKALEARRTAHIAKGNIPDDFLNSEQEFLTKLPGLRSFLQRSGLKDIKEGEELRIRLFPNQEMGTEGQKNNFPDLDISLDINRRSEKVSLASSRLVFPEGEVDLLLPDEGTDIKFTSRSFVPLDKQLSPHISTFVENSNLNVFGQERLRTPTSLTISVPSHAIRPVSGTKDDATNKTIGTIGSGISADILVNYTFARLEHLSSFSGKLSGASVQYTVIEAGKTGGKREELRMLMQAPTLASQAPRPARVAELGRFVEAARTLARDITASSVNKDSPLFLNQQFFPTIDKEQTLSLQKHS